MNAIAEVTKSEVRVENPGQAILESLALNNAEQAVRLLRIRDPRLALWHLKEAINQIELALGKTAPTEKIIEVEPLTNHDNPEHGRTEQGAA